MIQTIIAGLFGIVASIYVIKKIINQFNKSEINTKCENCPIPELQQSQKKN